MFAAVLWTSILKTRDGRRLDGMIKSVKERTELFSGCGGREAEKLVHSHHG